MKRLIVLFFLYILCVNKVYAASDKSRLENFEFEVGVGYAWSDYTIDTVANSILKWRDIRSIEALLNTKYKLSEETKLMANITLAYVYSGEMTDDDLENCTTFCVYSRTKKLDGSDLKFDFAVSQNFFQSNDNAVNFVFGGRYKRVKYEPKGYYQVIYNNGVGSFGNIDGETQHSTFQTLGPIVGLEYERKSANNILSLSANAFVAFYTDSYQQHWNYSWDAGGRFASSYGFDLRLLTGFKLTNKMWLNFYSAYEYIRGNGMDQTFPINGTLVTIGEIDYLEYSKLTIGTSLSFK
jgi:hypothetical protein